MLKKKPSTKKKSGKKVAQIPRAKGGLTRWFAENWVDVKTGKPCGRSKGGKTRLSCL